MCSGALRGAMDCSEQLRYSTLASRALLAKQAQVGLSAEGLLTVTYVRSRSAHRIRKLPLLVRQLPCSDGSIDSQWVTAQVADIVEVHSTGHPSRCTQVCTVRPRPYRSPSAWTARALCCTVCAAWCMVHGAWCMVYGVWCMLHGACCTLHVVMLHAACCMPRRPYRCRASSARTALHRMALRRPRYTLSIHWLLASPPQHRTAADAPCAFHIS